MRSIHDMKGVVTKLLPANKCVVTFTAFGSSQTGLLLGDRLIVNGLRIMVPLTEYVKIGTKLRFSCHEFGSKDNHEYGYYVTSAWYIDESTIAGRTPSVFLGLYNCAGKIHRLEKRIGVINYTDHEDQDHSVMFLASKVYLFGKRSSTKRELKEVVNLDEAVLFDAIPCAPDGNDFGCNWFATLVWRGQRPDLEYDSFSPQLQYTAQDIFMQYKVLAANPKSLFVRTKGQVLKVIDRDYGIALMQVKKNRFDTVLFHRSACFLFKLCLTTQNLEDIFKEGDRLKIIATPAPKIFVCQWVATQITLDL